MLYRYTIKYQQLPVLSSFLKVLRTGTTQVTSRGMRSFINCYISSNHNSTVRFSTAQTTGPQLLESVKSLERGECSARAMYII